MCRKQHGAAFATYAQVKKKTLTVSDPGAKLVRYRSSEKATRSFCGACGSSLFWESSETPEVVDVAIGTLDVPLDMPIFAHIFVADKAEWVTIEDDLRQYDGTYVPDPPADPK